LRSERLRFSPYSSPIPPLYPKPFAFATKSRKYCVRRHRPFPLSHSGRNNDWSQILEFGARTGRHPGSGAPRRAKDGDMVGFRPPGSADTSHILWVVAMSMDGQVPRRPWTAGSGRGAWMRISRDPCLPIQSIIRRMDAELLLYSEEHLK
jgi:hypothetical protein